MRKFLLLLTFLCTLFTSVNATEVEIGDPAGANASNNTILPFSSTYNYGWSQQIYTADEIGMAGTINSLSLWIYSTSNISSFSIQIYMAEVDKESFESTSDWVVLSASDLVFTGALTNLPSSAADMAEVTLDLDAPFSYSGQGNLLIAVANNTGSWNGGLNFKVFGETTDPYRALYKNQDGNAMGPDAPAVAGTRLAKRNVIKLDITAAGGVQTCDKPDLVEANDVTANSATISWTGSASTYNLQYKASSDQEWTLVKNLTGSSYQLSDLVSNTDYQVQVQAICGDNTSGWKSVSFRTLIDLPYLEQFKSSSIPTGWGRYTGALNDDGSATLTSTDSYWIFGTQNGVFDTHAHIEVYSTRNAWLVTPTIPIPALEPDDPGYLLSFNMALTYWTGNNVPCTSRASQPDARFVVLASLDGGANWNILREWNNTGSAYVYDDIVCSADGEEVTIDISAYAGQSVQLAFYVYHNSGGDNRIHIDDVFVGLQPTCLKPTDLHEVEGMTTKNSLQVAWTANSGETDWRVQHKVSNDTTAEWITSDVSTNPYTTISGLQPFTNYDIRVAAVCSETDFTDYGKTITIRTAAGVPFVEKFDTTALPGEWKRYEVLLENLQNGAPMAPVAAGWNVATASGVFPAANRHLRLNINGADCKYWIVSPTIVMETGYQLTFDLALTKAAGSTPTAVTPGEQNDDKFIVFITDDGGENWNPILTWTNIGDGFSYDQIKPDGQFAKYDLSAYAGQPIQIAFYGESTDAVSQSSNYLHIANFKIAEIPACQQANSLIVTDITGSSANAVWEADEAGTWQYGYVVKPEGDFTPTDEQFTGSTEGQQVALTGLQETTTYIFFLRKSCGGSTSEILYKEFTTIQNPATLPYSADFEENNGGWLFHNGTQPNKWAWGTATANGGTHALYISSDNGVTNDYAQSTAVVFASKTFYFDETGMYSFSFDWKGDGEKNYDYLRVALVPLSTEFTPGTTPSGYSYSALPAGWIALDGGAQLSKQTEWQHVSLDYVIDQTGYYKIALIWKNNGYSGTNPPAAIDNFSIAHLDCTKPTGLAISGITATSATLVWNAETDGLPWVYAYAPASEPEPADDAFIDINVNSIELEGLAECTNYKFYLRKNCGETTKSESISISFQTKQLPVDAGESYSEDFEGEAKWLLNNGDRVNAWVIDTAAHNGEGTHALYISNDGGATHAYTNNLACVVFAQKAFNFAAGNYVFSYDWLCNGETTFDFIRVALVPADVELVPGTSLPSGVTYQALPKGCIALDGGIAMNLSTSWQTFTSDEVAVPAGTYNIVFMWRDDSSGGDNPPAAIDNFSFAKIACAMPADFHAVDSLATTTSVVLKWTQMSEEDDFVIRYKVYGEEAFADSVFVLNDDSTTLTGLVSGTAYELQVAAWCDPADATALGKYSASIYALTKCAAVETINQDFENAVLCWSYIQETNSTGTFPGAYIMGEGKAASGTNALYFLSIAGANAIDQYAILPELISLDNKRIKFNVRKEDDTDEDTYAIVGVMTDPADATSFEALDSLLVDANVYSQRFVSLDAYAGAGKYVAIKMPASTVDYATLIIDDVVVEDIPACVDPQGLHAIADEITSSSALLAWTPQGAESDWLVRYRISGAADWADTIHATNDTLLLENLAATTIYEAQVAAWCDPTDDEAVSPFSSSISFTTACEIISTFPYAENFDELTLASAYTPSARTLPTCWSAINTSTHSSYMYYPTAYYYSYTDYSNSKPNSLRFYSYYSSSTDYDPQDQYAILPQMDGISGLRMKFNARKYSSSNRGDSIVVGIMTDPEDIATFEPIQVIKPAAATYEPFEVRFDHYTGAGQYIALKLEAANASNTSRGLHIDDIVVEELPNCFEPEGLAVFDIEENSAKFTWTVEEGESYVYAVALASAGEPAEEAFATAADSMQVSGLVDNKDYILYLRKNCAGNYSPSISAAFHTLMAPATAPFADDFEAGNNWMFINGSLTNAWAYGEAAHNGEGTHAIYISKDGGATNAYTTSAASAVVYAVKSFNFEEGVYTFKYDWKAKGEGTSTMYDYLRVFIVPDSVELVPGTSLPTGLTATALPAAWNAIALDGGSAMNGVTSWQTFQTTDIAISAGAYKVVFLWKNDGSGGTNPPVAIDNFSISKITCLPVSELAVSGITSSSATIAWTAPEGQEAWQLAYSADPNFDIAEATPIDVASTTYALADLLTDTLYNVYVRANCGSEDGVSVWSQFSFRTAKACQTPDDLAAAPGSNTAEISWNTYGQTGFNLRYIQGTDTVLVPNVESPYEISGLQAATAYKVQVQAACESEDSWSAAINFKTAYSTPFEEKFAATSTPDDWARYSGLLAEVLDGGALTTTTSGWNFNTGNGVFNNHAKVNIFGTTCKYWLATPAVYVSGNVQLTFDLALTKYSNSLVQVEADAQADDKFAVLISTNNGNSWSVLRLWDNAGSEYVYNNIACSATGEPIAIDLSAYDGQAIKIAFYGESTVGSNGDNNLHIDNVLIDLVPTCLKPTGFSISDVKAHSAQLSWTAGDEGQSAWQIAYDTLPTNRPDTLLNIINVTENPYVLTGLDPETRYYAYVRANCGVMDGVSRWTDGPTFLTTIACPAPSALKATLTPGDGSVATLSWNAGQDEAAWIVEYSLNANLSDSIEVLAYDTFVNLTGLTAEQTYYARVKADCGELDGESLYSAIISFKPTNKYELLINDGTKTNAYVPINGNNVDYGTVASQFIVPAAQLESLEWDSITKLTFYATQDTSKWGASEFEVYMAPIEANTFDALVDWADLTQVMVSGVLSIVDNKMEVTLTEPFQYTGGNLLIGFKQTVASGSSDLYSESTWYGKNTTGASIGGYGMGNNMTQRNFLPKMLINYVPGVAPACPNPKNLAVSGITDSEATFTWKAVEGATWEYALVQGAAEPVSFISTEENSVTIADLAEATDYTFYLRRACGADGYSDATLSVAFTTELRVEAVPFVEDFEADGSWKFVNGTEPNAWVIGNATAKDGEKALYISNNGADNTYTKNAASASYATILLDFTLDGEYTFAYDWKANGDYDPEASELYDYLRVVLVPASATLVAGNPALPEGYIALDNGGLYGATEWQHHSSNAQIEAGLYKLVFAWFNDNQQGEDSPAAIDNISIQEKGPETGLINGNAGIFNNGEAIKFLRDNKVFILVNGVIYDATGRKVEVVK